VFNRRRKSSWQTAQDRAKKARRRKIKTCLGLVLIIGFLIAQLIYFPIEPMPALIGRINQTYVCGTKTGSHEYLTNSEGNLIFTKTDYFSGVKVENYIDIPLPPEKMYYVINSYKVELERLQHKQTDAFVKDIQDEFEACRNIREQEIIRKRTALETSWIRRGRILLHDSASPLTTSIATIFTQTTSASNSPDPAQE